MAPEDKSVELLTQLATVVQDLFIFQALQAGVTVENVRALVGVNQARVIRVSKVRKKDPKS